MSKKEHFSMNFTERRFDLDTLIGSHANGVLNM